MSKKIIFSLFVAVIFCCCSDDSKSAQTPVIATGDLFTNVKPKVDEQTFTITITSKVDSLIVCDFSSLGGSLYYLALDTDMIDPSINWESKLDSGAVIVLNETEFVHIVVLDSSKRVVSVWNIEQQKGETDKSESSSSEVNADSLAESSSSEVNADSSAKSSSSKVNADSLAESSSSQENIQSSSSVLSSSSKEQCHGEFLLQDIISECSKDANCDTVIVTNSKVYVQTKYGANISSMSFLPQASETDYWRVTKKELIDLDCNAKEFDIVAGVQLPGTDFDARDNFWATTSDAMAESKTGSGIKVFSEANLEFSSSVATITTREVTGELGFIPGSWKMAGGFYFSGSYSGTDALHIYEQGYTSGTPSAKAESDISKDMTFGKPFNARPTAFELTYQYDHVANKSSEYPQKSLVYVLLVSANNEVVATGAIIDEVSVSKITKKVELNYGADPFNILGGSYAVSSALTLGTGNEDIAYIHIMFASSAYAHVVAGGTLGNSGNYRGGENSKLSLDKFKLIY